MAWTLITTESPGRWYVFERQSPTADSMSVIATFDPAVVPVFRSKADAKAAAKGLGLKTWRYKKLEF